MWTYFKDTVYRRTMYTVKYVYTFAQTLLKIWFLIGEIALLTNMVKQTFIYVEYCADSFRLFCCIILRLFNFCLLY